MTPRPQHKTSTSTIIGRWRRRRWRFQLRALIHAVFAVLARDGLNRGTEHFLDRTWDLGEATALALVLAWQGKELLQLTLAVELIFTWWR